MAQKPIPKAPPPPSLPNEKSNNNNSNGTKVNVQTAQSEQGNNQRTKNDSSESDSEKGILKDLLSATIENTSNISPKPQRQRQTRIASDPGERESFQSGISPRSNSYHGQSTAGRESYAAKSANLPQQNPPKSPSLRHKNQPPRPSSAPPKPQSQLQIQGNSASQVVNQSWTGIQINNKSVGNNNSFNKSQRGPVRRARSGESGFDSSEESAVKSGQAFKREERNSREGRK